VCLFIGLMYVCVHVCFYMASAGLFGACCGCIVIAMATEATQDTCVRMPDVCVFVCVHVCFPLKCRQVVTCLQAGVHLGFTYAFSA
jgi:hypothetical protein